MANRVSLPIKNSEDLCQFKKAIRKGAHGYRNLVITEIALTTGLRINDILKLKKKDIFDDFLTFKTEKDEERVSEIIRGYCEGLNDDDYLFDIRYGQAWRMIKKAANECNLQGISSHSLRKTAALHFYHEVNYDIRLTQEFLNHESIDETIDYLKISEDEVNQKLVTSYD